MSEATDAEDAAADLAAVRRAIEAVDYNNLSEADLQRLLGVRGTIQNITEEYRDLATVLRDLDDDADTEGGA